MTAKEFRTQMERVGRRMYLAALRVTGSEADAEDAVQDAMCRLWKRLDSFAKANNREAYATATARRCALNLIGSSHSGSDLEEVTEIAVPEETYDTRERLEIIFRIIEQLPSPQREVITLHDINGLEMVEIQQKLNLTAGNARVILSRARATVRKRYEEYDR